MAPFDQTLRRLMDGKIGSRKLSALTGIPKTTIDNWLHGIVARPRDWRPILRIAQALLLTRDEVETLLLSAQLPTLDRLAAQVGPEHPDRRYLQGWLATSYRPLPRRHQLRPPVADFVGREAEAAQLVSALRTALTAGRGAIISGVQGMGGIGKTELAYVVANQLRDAFPDAQIVLNLQGPNATPLTTEQALQEVIHAFMPDAKLPERVEALEQHYRTVLHDQKVLILADDARDAAQVRPLIPPLGCALLITSRARLTLPGMTRVHLEQLDEQEAVALLRRICDRVREAEAQAIAQACDYLPLALRISASILRNNPALPVVAYLRRLADERQRLSQLRDPDDAGLDVEAALAVSYVQLDTTTQRVFRQLGMLVADFTIELARAVVESDANVNTEDILYFLLRRNLVMYDAERGRWRLHDLLRDLACNYLKACGEWEATAWHYARAAVQIAQTTEDQYQAGGDGALAALARFDTERPHIDAGRRWATAHAGVPQADALLVQDALAIHLIGRLRHDGWREQLPQLQGALAAAQRLGDQQQIARLLLRVGRVYIDLGAPHQVRQYAQQALAIVRTLGDREGEQRALMWLAVSHAQQGALCQAITFYEQALTMAEEQYNWAASTGMLADLGRIYGEAGMFEQALPYLDQARKYNRVSGDPYDECLILAALGRVYVAMGDAPRAIATLEHALTQARAIQSRLGEAELLSILGQACVANGDDVGAVPAFEAALAMFHELGDRWAEAECQWHFGLALAHQGQRERSLPLLHAAVAYKEEIGHAKATEHGALLARLEAGRNCR